jgi:hypothetical protein
MTIGAAVSAQQFSPAEWTDGLLKLRADLTPRVNAVADLEGRSLSFKDLYSASSELAREIERSQDPPGLIAVTLPNCINAMVAAFAVFRSRHALLMVHPQLPNAARHPVFGRLHPVGEIVPDGSGLRIVREPYGPAMRAYVRIYWPTTHHRRTTFSGGIRRVDDRPTTAVSGR